MLQFHIQVCQFSLNMIWSYILEQLNLLELCGIVTSWCGDFFLRPDPPSTFVFLQLIVRRKLWVLTVGIPAWTALSRPQSGAPALKLAAWACPPGSPIRTVGVRWWSRADCVWSDPVTASRTRRSWHSLCQRYFLGSFPYTLCMSFNLLQLNCEWEWHSFLGDVVHILSSLPTERQQVPEDGEEWHSCPPLL